MFVSHKARILRKFGTSTNSQSTNLRWLIWMLVKLRFRDLCEWSLFGLCTFDILAISMNQKRGKNQKDKV